MAYVFCEPEGLVKLRRFGGGENHLVHCKIWGLEGSIQFSALLIPTSHELTVPKTYSAATCTRVALQIESSSKYTLCCTTVNCAVSLYLFAPLLAIQQAAVLKVAGSSAYVLMEAYKASGYSKPHRGIGCSGPQV